MGDWPNFNTKSSAERSPRDSSCANQFAALGSNPERE